MQRIGFLDTSECDDANLQRHGVQMLKGLEFWQKRVDEVGTMTVTVNKTKSACTAHEWNATARSFTGDGRAIVSGFGSEMAATLSAAAKETNSPASVVVAPLSGLDAI